ncbi:OmpH family outer membrane protein [Rubritepida flocculans]|uniref:OmpH family outer membrane protein n=1 Tax=Rubritepida flocculans TaxID=182403 RepID=UPI0004291B3B|nr:OmpH family outer membrane protein [Rubritepida flocculans]
MTSLRLPLALLLGLLPGMAAAQQNQEWFVPGQQRPPQAQPQRPPQQPQQGQRPAQQPQQAQRPAGQQPPAAVIGVVDIQEVQRLSTAVNQLREEIERRRSRLNEDLQREQNAWREAQQSLANQRAQLTADQIRQRERELQDRITASQTIFRNRSQAIEQAAQQALVQIEESLANIVRSVAQARNINLVLPRPLVIMNAPEFDLTEEVAQQFNRTMRQVNIPAESDGSAAPAAAAAPRAAAPAQQPRRN